jgi:3-oxoacyl-[acyl-carrier-protein] synthase-3
MKSKLGTMVKLSGSAIKGIVSCVPSKIITNDYFFERFGEAIVASIEKMAGVHSRRWSSGENTSDLCASAASHLMNNLNWDPESVDALIFVSQTPDYIMPATSTKIQGKVGINNNCLTFDVNLGCSGYPYALWLASMLIQTGSAKRVILAVGETPSKIIDKNDRSTALLFGDAGTATAVELANNIFSEYLLGSDSSGQSNLIIPGSRFSNYEWSLDERMKTKNPDCLFMDGNEIFNFTLKAVPQIYNAISSNKRDNLDYVLMHQANLFMLNHLIKKCSMDNDKTLINIEDYGNTSSASIPLLITTRLKCEDRLNACHNVLMMGFGIGYSWSATIQDFKYLEFLDTIIYDE